MIHADLIKHVVQTLESNAIPYMITGSVASSALGEPRMTHDLDVVVELDGRHVRPLLEAFPAPDYYIEEQAVRVAIQRDGMFNVIDNKGVGKIDFWMLKDDPLDDRAFSRRTRSPLLDVDAELPRPSDLILLKLRWARESGGSERQLRDCKGILEVHRHQIDLEEMDHWALRFGVQAQWRDVRAMAGF